MQAVGTRVEPAEEGGGEVLARQVPAEPLVEPNHHLAGGLRMLRLPPDDRPDHRRVQRRGDVVAREVGHQHADPIARQELDVVDVAADRAGGEAAPRDFQASEPKLGRRQEVGLDAARRLHLPAVRIRLLSQCERHGVEPVAQGTQLVVAVEFDLDLSPELSPLDLIGRSCEPADRAEHGPTHRRVDDEHQQHARA